MSEYVTKKDLELSEVKTGARIDQLSVKMDSKFDLLSSKIDSLSDNLPLMIRDNVRTENDRLASERKQDRHYIMATWVIGGLGLAAAVVSIIVSVMH